MRASYRVSRPGGKINMSLLIRGANRRANLNALWAEDIIPPHDAGSGLDCGGYSSVG